MNRTKYLAVPGAFALVLFIILSAGAAEPPEQSNSSAHVLVGMTPNTGFEVTCDDSLILDEPVVSDGLGIVGFTVDRASLPDQGLMCLRRPAAPDVIGCTIDQMDTHATICWTTDRVAYSHVDYGTASGYLPYSSPESPELAIEHAAFLDLLNPETTYFYRMVSRDAFGNTATTNVSSFETCPPAPAIENVAVGDVGHTSFRVSWTTSAPAISRVEYGTMGPGGDGVVEADDLVTEHDITVDGLTQGTTYFVRLVAVDECGCSSSLETDPVSTTSPADPVEIVGVSVLEVTPETATIRWWTTTPASSQVFYGDTPALGLSTALEAELVTSHLAVINGLEPSTLHYFRVESVDEYDQTATSDIFTFTTDEPDEPQELSIYNVSVHVADGPTATISWITNLPATTRVDYGPTLEYGRTVESGDLAIQHMIVLDDLEPRTVYHFRATSSGAATGLEAATGDMMFTTHGVADLYPPTAPEGLVAVATDRAVELSWEAATAGDLAGYTVYRRREGHLLYEPLAHIEGGETEYVDHDIVVATYYDYTVAARDISGNESGLSEEVRAMAGVGAAGSMWIYPNPVAEETTIRFVPPRGESGTDTGYSLRIYDVAGRLVRSMDGSGGTSEPRTVHWDATDDGGARVASGTYFCVASNGAGVLRSKVMVLR